MQRFLTRVPVLAVVAQQRSVAEFAGQSSIGVCLVEDLAHVPLADVMQRGLCWIVFVCRVYMQVVDRVRIKSSIAGLERLLAAS